MFSLFDCHRPTYRGHTGFVFPVGKSDFPSPAAAFSQLNNGVFYSFVFHKISPHVSEADISQSGCPVCSLVNLTVPMKGITRSQKQNGPAPMRRPNPEMKKESLMSRLFEALGGQSKKMAEGA
jgi:hypothetical protein